MRYTGGTDDVAWAIVWFLVAAALPVLWATLRAVAASLPALGGRSPALADGPQKAGDGLPRR